MTNLVIGLLGALLASNAPAAVSNLVEQTTGVSVTIPNPNDPVEKAYQKILDDDDAALATVTAMIQTNNAASEKGLAKTPEAMADSINKFTAPVRKEYEDFLKEHPEHVRAHLAFGGFLGDLHDEEEAKAEFETALKLDPKNPAAWNDLGNMLSHIGPVTNMFACYDKAIELDPREPVYLENLATCVFLYRTDAREYYHFTNDQQIFDRSLELYEKAFAIATNDFALATELAQTYYGITPVRTDDALNAWTNALKIAKTDLERQGVYVHLARFKLNADRFAESHADIDKVTDPALMDLKNRILRNLALREKAEKPVLPAPRITCPNGRRCELIRSPAYFRA